MQNLHQHVLKEMDIHLLVIKNKSRFPIYQVLGNGKSKYFSDQANFAAYKHRAMMQVCSFVHFYFYFIS
jgi:hypothetical protein